MLHRKLWWIWESSLLLVAGCASSGAELQRQAFIALEADRYDEAADLYSQVIAEDEDSGSAYLGRALAHDRSDRTMQALEDYRRAAKLEPSNSSLPLYLAELQLRRGELAAAREEVRSVLVLSDDDLGRLDRFAALAIAGRIELADDKLYEARDRFRSALALGQHEPELSSQPLFRSVLYLAAHAEYELRRFDRSRSHLQEYLEAVEQAGERPTSGDYYLLTLTSYLDGDFEAAAGHLPHVDPEGRARLASELGDDRFFLAAR